MARVLGVRRLSHDTDASTSIERQGESVEYWAMAHGAKLTQWDILCVAKLDRLTVRCSTREAGTTVAAAFRGDIRQKLDTAIADWEARAIAGDTAESVRYTTELMTDRWLSLSSDHDRGALLRLMRIRIMARKANPGKVSIRLQQGDKHWAEVAREWTDADVEDFEAEKADQRQ